MDTSEYPEEIVAEGDRIAKAYAVKFTPQELGTVVAVEKTLPCEPPEVITEENRSDELIERWEGFEADVLGVSDRLGLGRIPLTCRSDLVVRLTKDDCDRIYETRAVETTPGLWIVDHKTAARRDSLGAEKWAHDIQMSLNFLLWNACHDLWPGECSEPCVGVLVNTIYKTKEVGFETFVVRPTGDQCKAALGAVKLAARIRTDPTLREAPNPTRCFQYFEMCRFLQTAQCRRF